MSHPGQSPSAAADPTPSATNQAPPTDLTPSSAMSLRELRSDLLQRASLMAGKARAARRRGHLREARALQHKAERLVEIARSVRIS